jgi:hypothetical protein
MNKYLKCAAATVGVDLGIGTIACMAEGFTPDNFFVTSGLSLIFLTPAAIIFNVFDKYVNQNISDNKFFQYGAIIAETELIAGVLPGPFAVTVVAALKACTMKYILDNAKATNESEVADEVLHNNDVIGDDPQNNNNYVIGDDSQNNNDLTGNYYS